MVQDARFVHRGRDYESPITALRSQAPPGRAQREGCGRWRALRGGLAELARACLNEHDGGGGEHGQQHKEARLAPEREGRRGGRGLEGADLEMHGERVEPTTWSAGRHFLTLHTEYIEGEGTIDSQNVNSQN